MAERSAEDSQRHGLEKQHRESIGGKFEGWVDSCPIGPLTPRRNILHNQPYKKILGYVFNLSKAGLIGGPPRTCSRGR